MPLRHMAPLLPLCAILLFAPLAAAEVTLQFKYPENSAAKTNVDVEAAQKLTISGNEIETKSEQHMVLGREIGARADDGTLRVAYQIESLQAQVALPDGTDVLFDSVNADKEATNESEEVVRGMFRTLAQSRWVKVLNKQNEVAAIEGKEKVLASAPEKVRPLIEGQFDPEYLRQVATQEAARLPDKPVKKGDSWQRSETVRLEAGQVMTFEKEYTYAGAQPRDTQEVHQINVKTTGVKLSLADDSPLPITLAESMLNVESSEGTLWFDNELGDLVETQEKVHIVGDLKFKTRDGKELPAELDLTMQWRTTRQ